MRPSKYLLFAALSSFLATASLCAYEMQSVANIQALRSFSTWRGRTNVFVEGYFRPNDGGGGIFTWISNSSAPTNSGTVISPVNPSTGGKWLRQYSGPINIRWFGAVGDGSTDDTAAIQAAINVAIANRSGVFVPAVSGPHYYKCATGLTVLFENPGSSLCITGEGLQSYLFFTGSGDCLTIDSTRAGGSLQKTQLSFADFAIGGGAKTRDGLVLKSTHRGTFKNFCVLGVGRSCISLQGSFLNTFVGGGATLNLGSPGNAVQALPQKGFALELDAEGVGSNGNMIIGASFEGVAQSPKTIIDASNESPIAIRTGEEHGYADGDIIAISGVVGNKAANGAWKITVIGDKAFRLNGSVGSAAYEKGGTVSRGVGIFVAGPSYGNTFMGGTSENNAVGVFVDDKASGGFFFNNDISQNTVDFHDHGYITSHINSNSGAVLTLGNRVLVNGTDISRFFPDDGEQAAFIRTRGAAMLFGRNPMNRSSDFRIAAQGRAGAVRLLSNVGTNGSMEGALEVATASQVGGVPLLKASNNFEAGGNVTISTAGKGLLIKEGPNARMGKAILNGGSPATVTVNTTNVTENTRIFLTAQTAGGAIGYPYVSARTPGASFVITSSASGDTNSIAWFLIEPSP